MPGRQVRLEEAVVAAIRRNRATLGFPADTPDGAMLSELAREGMRSRLEARRRRERSALYAGWAEERDLIDDAGEAVRSATRNGIA
ncbi:MAG TPA: hypothetical protein VF998_04725 [Candidatus Limnocylindria bacterium]